MIVHLKTTIGLSRKLHAKEKNTARQININSCLLYRLFYDIFRIDMCDKALFRLSYTIDSSS